MNPAIIIRAGLVVKEIDPIPDEQMDELCDNIYNEMDAFAEMLAAKYGVHVDLES